MKETRKRWACLVCKNRKNDLSLKNCYTCSAVRPVDCFAIRRDGFVYICKAFTGLAIPMLSIMSISPDNEEKHVRMKLPMNHDNVADCVQEGLELLHYGALDSKEETDDEKIISGEGSDKKDQDGTLSITIDGSTTSTSMYKSQSELDSAGKPLVGLSLFDRMMRDAKEEAYDPAIGRFIPTSTVYLSPNRDIIKTDLNYIVKMEKQKMEMVRVVDTTIKRRDIALAKQAEHDRKKGLRATVKATDKTTKAATTASGTGEDGPEPIVFQQLSRDEPAVKEPRVQCSLCERVYPLSSLMGRITFKAVSEWRAAHAAPIPAEDKRFNSAYIHNAAKLCLLCTAFFDADFSECLDQSSIHETIGIEVDPIDGVKEPTNKASRLLLKEYSEIEKDSQRPLSAMKHKVNVDQILAAANRNNDPNAKYLYDPRATQGSKLVDAASNARTLRDTYTDTVIVKQLQQRGQVEERNAKEREAKRRAWLDRLSGKMTTSPPKKGVSGNNKDKNNEKEKDLDKEPSSARSDTGPKSKGGKSRSPSLSRSKTAGEAGSLKTVRERRGRKVQRATSLTRRGGSTTSHKIDVSGGNSVESRSRSQSVKKKASFKAGGSLRGQRGRSATSLSRGIKSSGYTATPWGVTPIKTKQRGSSLPPRSRSSTAESAASKARLLKPRTYSKASVPRLSGRAKKEARLAPAPVVRKPLLVMVRDKKNNSGVVTMELLSKQKQAAALAASSSMISENILNGTSLSDSTVKTTITSHKVVPIEPLLRNRRVTKQQEVLIRGAASAYNPLGKYSPPDSKKKRGPSVITKSTHATSAVPSIDDQVRVRMQIDELVLRKKSVNRSLSPPSMRVPDPSPVVHASSISSVGFLDVDPPMLSSMLIPSKAVRTRPTLEIMTKATVAAAKPTAKAVTRLRSPPPAPRVDTAEEEILSDISDKDINISFAVGDAGDNDEDEYIHENGLLAKLKSIDGSPSISKTNTKTTKMAPDEDKNDTNEYEMDFVSYDPQHVVHLAESALNEIEAIKQEQNGENGEQDEQADLSFAPGQDTMEDYMFASAGIVQKAENPDKWSPTSPLHSPGRRRVGFGSGPRNGPGPSVDSVEKILFTFDDFEQHENALVLKGKSPKHAKFSPSLSLKKNIALSDIDCKNSSVSPQSHSPTISHVPTFNAPNTDERNKSMRMTTLTKQQQLIDRLEERQLQHMIDPSFAINEDKSQIQKNLADAYSYLGDANNKKGNFLDALSSYENSFLLQKDTLMQQPEVLHAKLESMIGLAMSTGDHEKATHFCENLVFSALENFGERSIQFAKSELFTGHVLMKQEGTGPTDAIELISDAISILNQNLGTEHKLTKKALSALDAAKVAAAVAVAQKRSNTKAKEKSSSTSSTPSPSKKTKGTSEHLTSTKKHREAAEQEVQKRISDEVAQKVATEKKKMMQQMEKQVQNMLSKQISEQMAAAQAAMMQQMQMQQQQIQMQLQTQKQSIEPSPTVTSVGVPVADSVSTYRPSTPIKSSIKFLPEALPLIEKSNSGREDNSISTVHRSEETDAVLANMSPSPEKYRSSTPIMRYKYVPGENDEDDKEEKNKKKKEKKKEKLSEAEKEEREEEEEEEEEKGSQDVQLQTEVLNKVVLSRQYPYPQQQIEAEKKEKEIETEICTSGYVIDTEAYTCLASPTAMSINTINTSSRQSKPQIHFIQATTPKHESPSKVRIQSPPPLFGRDIDAGSSGKKKSGVRIRSPPPPSMQADTDDDDDDEEEE